MLLHEVLTTEKVPFHYRVAGLGARLLAWLVDCGFIAVLGFAGLMSFGVYNIGRPGLGMGIGLLWLFALSWGYFLLFEWQWHGQTLGKWLVGIRVIQWRGTALTFLPAAVRNIVRAVDALPFLYGIGFIVAACNREHRRLGDLAAGTLVVHVEQKPEALAAAPEVGVTEKARDALLRQRLSQLDRQQKQTLLELCLRRDQMRVRERARLFGALAQYFEGRLGLVRETYQSEEKFVLRLAAIVSEQGKALDGV